MFKKPIVGEAAIKWLIQVADLPQYAALNAYNAAVRMHKIEQLSPPMKGVFVKYNWKEINSSLDQLNKRILAVCSQRAARNPNYKFLYDFEVFQSGQKGPVHDVTGNAIVESVDKVAEHSKEEIVTQSGLSLLDKASLLLRKQLVQEGLSGIIKRTDIAPSVAWSAMNHSSKRGLPWLDKGNKVVDWRGKRVTLDDAIMGLYGNDMHKIVDSIAQMKAVVGVIGLRFQGTPEKDKTKVRIIFMPEVPEQYGLRAVQYPIQNILKAKNCQMGYAWADPDQYKFNMRKAMRGQNVKYYYISLDYSKYDTRSSYHVRDLALKVLLGVLLSDDIEWKAKLINEICRLWYEQYMLAPNDQGSASVYHVPNLLTSGDVFTQLLGNTMNRLYQYAISIALGYELDPSLGLELGDDTVIPIPTEIVDRAGGYEKILEAIEKIIGTWGSMMNVKKQYPNMESSIFLQRLYKFDSNIEGEYSLIRASQSLVWAERPRTPIQGVWSLDALETIGQLGLLNLISIDWGRVTNKDILQTMILPWWLGYDTALLALSQDAFRVAKGDPKLGGAYVFSYLIKAAGGSQAVIDGFELNAYDQYGLKTILGAKKSLFSSLPILSELCIAASKMPGINFDYTSVYKVKDKVHPQLLSDYVSEKE